LKATVKATPVDAYGPDSTIHHVGLAGHIQNNPGWTSTDALNRKFLELQNRWSASWAMSTDGSFPSSPAIFWIGLAASRAALRGYERLLSDPFPRFTLPLAAEA